MSFPDVIRFGAAYLVSPKLDLRLDFEWVRWSRLQRQCVVNVDASCNINADTGAEIVPPGGDAKVLLNLDRRWKDAFGSSSPSAGSSAPRSPRCTCSRSTTPPAPT
ncbi:MAG: hypothetical protein IPJ34_34120 [Myxococcales bacterium]|nr:hypothetical protein [Myxococcales bacterium]